MAAHIWRYFCEAMELNGEGKFDQVQMDLFKNALDFAPLGNQIDFDDYKDLHDAETPGTFIYFVLHMLERYHQDWLSAGQPRNYEDWMERIPDMTHCPTCGNNAVSSHRLGYRIWAGCWHVKEEVLSDSNPV